jgi:hypothetical protein
VRTRSKSQAGFAGDTQCSGNTDSGTLVACAGSSRCHAETASGHPSASFELRGFDELRGFVCSPANLGQMSHLAQAHTLLGLRPLVGSLVRPAILAAMVTTCRSASYGRERHFNCGGLCRIRDRRGRYRSAPGNKRGTQSARLVDCAGGF